MYKACSRCGKVHDINHKCYVGKIYKQSTANERNLRATNRWKMKSEEIRERANYLCEVCRDEGVYTYKGLEVHHITKLKDNPQGLLDNNNLVCLCVLHHKMADNGEIDKEYLLNLAEKREGE
nr:MAG TPA: NinG recombination protein [Caudoviricetes sp.]